MRAAALVFDVDGTLAETEEVHRAAFNAAFAAAGLPWRWSVDDYRRLLTTTGGKERITRHIREIGAEGAGIDIAALHADKTRRYGAMVAAGGLALRPGVAALIAAARAAGRPVAVATTTSRPNVEALALACFGQAAAEGPIWPGITLQTSTFCTSPSITTSIVSGRTSTAPPPKSGPIHSTMPA